MKDTAGYKLSTFPSSRQFTMDVGKIGMKKHHIKALIEIDVTDAHNKIRENQTAHKISFTSWVLKCIGHAISEHQQVHALRKGRNKLIIFDHIDMSIVVEKKVNDTLVPLPMVLRKVDEKKINEIYDEIEKAKQKGVGNDKDYVIEKDRKKDPIKLFSILPQPLRLIIWKIMLSNPFRVKKMMGTVIVTSVGMMGKVSGWLIPYSMHPLCFALGSIIEKPAVNTNNEVKIREFLHMTVLIDHDVVDGAPAARFVTYLVKLMENGFGL